MSVSGIVAQKLRDTYPTLTAEEVDCIVDSESGKTLRETLEDAVKRHMDGEAQVFGAGFHDRLKAKYQKRSDVFIALTPKPENGKMPTACPELVKASRDDNVYCSDDWGILLGWWGMGVVGSRGIGGG